MDISTKEDIEVPVDRVYAEATNFEHLERQIMRRGIELRRISPAGEGSHAWHAVFAFRGKARAADITLVEEDAPNLLVYRSVTDGLEVLTRIEFVALSRSRTRVAMALELKPKTLSARLMVQSLKLARANLEKKFRVRMAEYAQTIEDRLKRA
ncbi:SRPBCC family protein [Salipiger mangrovisoli]|uniref:SRPBCC family protein n=1 Tax=Salipiger mangrovisoli TaxID=2865933 RepID=A0ABR9XA62_9RHOB|nr:SRPBCC family protein [Salipiger mangrovisoli]MBE9640403.1 SRPBCC family protein [Salipiger mangrovisoli]